jgi:prepilin-type N-terminal cleavage/methylation domain-containing protein
MLHGGVAKMRHQARYGMTLVELLTVIAIIAVLTAILMPVIGSVRESGRQAQCISNMHKIGIAVSAYRNDNSGEFPPMLLGPVEDSNGNPITNVAEAVPMAKMQRSYLYPKYINDLTVFRCPDNPMNDTLSIVSAVFTPSGQIIESTFGRLGIDSATASAQVPYYAYDSYDITAAPGASDVHTVTYSRDWSGPLLNQAIGSNDAPNQMKYRNPPPDQTVITWCNYHSTNGHGSMCPVLLVSGTCKTVPANTMASKGWAYASPN